MSVVVLIALCAVAFMALTVVWKVLDHYFGLGHDSVDTKAVEEVLKLVRSIEVMKQGVIELEESLTIKVGTITSRKTLAAIKRGISNSMYLKLSGRTK